MRGGPAQMASPSPISRPDVTAEKTGILDRQATDALNHQGWALVPGLLDAQQCQDLIANYDAPIYRSHIQMHRHGYGRGEYKYFDYPLPDPVQDLRRQFYAALAPTARDWVQKLGGEADFPDTLEGYLKVCHGAGQHRPTPLILRYGEGDYNCLHQDLYGTHHFPLQLAILLSEPGVDFDGGEFVLTEQRPRMQSRAHVVPLKRGDAVIFAVRDRPASGKRRFHRRVLRHGVSKIRCGQRHTLGIIFHDAT